MMTLAIALTLPLLAPVASPTGYQCFNVRNVSSRFARVDPRTINVGVNGKDVYQLRIIGPCGGIDWVRDPATLGSRTGGSTVCKAGDLDVFAASPLGTRQCRVQEMRKLTPDEVAALPKKQRP